MLEPEPKLLRSAATVLQGNISGVYFLYDGEELVYVDQGWNRLIRVAEHTPKDSEKTFTHRSFLAVESESERRALERRLRVKHRPKYNKV